MLISAQIKDGSSVLSIKAVTLEHLTCMSIFFTSQFLVSGYSGNMCLVIKLCVVGILALGLPSVYGSAQNPEDVFLSGWQMDGPIITTSPSSNPQQCLQSCKENSLCQFAEFHIDSRTCDLKQESTSTRRNIKSVLVASSYKELARLPGIDTYGSENYGNGNGDVDNVYHPTGTEEACRKLCSIHPRCNAATFSGMKYAPNSKRSCWMRQVTKPVYYERVDSLSFFA